MSSQLCMHMIPATEQLLAVNLLGSLKSMQLECTSVLKQSVQKCLL